MQPTCDKHLVVSLDTPDIHWRIKSIHGINLAVNNVVFNSHAVNICIGEGLLSILGIHWTGPHPSEPKSTKLPPEMKLPL